jgi:antitoxin (DNA-binding transcriptional repressor) of toxin-antitoxin stability system
MKTVTLTRLRKDGAFLDRAARGEELLVTRFGKPYVRILPAGRRRSFVGAGRHLGVIEPLDSEPIPASEFGGLW